MAKKRILVERKCAGNEEKAYIFTLQETLLVAVSKWCTISTLGVLLTVDYGIHWCSRKLKEKRRCGSIAREPELIYLTIHKNEAVLKEIGATLLLRDEHYHICFLK